MSLQNFNPEIEIKEFLIAKEYDKNGLSIQFLHSYAGLILQLADKWQSYHLIQIPDVSNVRQKISVLKRGMDSSFTAILDDVKYRTEWNNYKAKINEIKDRFLKAYNENLL